VFVFVTSKHQFHIYLNILPRLFNRNCWPCLYFQRWLSFFLWWRWISI